MLIGIVLALIFIPIILAGAYKAMQGRTEPIEEKSVLHLDLHGRLVEKARPLDFDLISASPFSDDERGNGLFELTEAIRLAKDDKRIQGMLIEIHDLDAGWAMSEALRRAIVEFRKAGKFVSAYAETLDEQGYFLATAADTLYLQPNGDVEFNGLGMSEPFLKGLFAKLEVQPRIFRVGKFKAAVEPLILDKMSDENRLQNQMLITDLWDVVRNTVQRKGKATPQQLDQIASNLEVNSAEQALKSGMVDQLAFRDEVIDALTKKTVGEAEELRLVTPGHLLAAHPKTPLENADKIAVIFAEGDIVSGSGDRNSIGSHAFVEDLEEARKDETVKAIVVRINSPGGDALASDVIWRELSIIDKEIPVIASMGDVAASGGYYMAAGAREIFAESATITGSIGVFGILFDAEKALKNKLGVNVDRVVSHPYADIGSVARPMSDFERQKIQNEVERVYGRFVTVVKESRGLPDTMDASTFAEGRVWSGVRAKQMKLVDQIGGLNTAIKRAATLAKVGEDYELDIFPRPEDPLKQLLSMVSTLR